jgi:hypothetical protein
MMRRLKEENGLRPEKTKFILWSAQCEEMKDKINEYGFDMQCKFAMINLIKWRNQ